MKVLISGGSGLIGKQLSKMLRQKGYDVGILSRTNKENKPGKNSEGITIYNWDIEKKYIDPEAIETAAYIVHLAGENLMDKRWTERQKKKIIDSRVKTANLLFEKVRDSRKQLKAFISASAVGYYGSVTSEHIFNEDDPPASDFLGTVCRQWEEAADQFSTLGIRTVKIRTSPVFAKEGGILRKLSLPVKLWLGAGLGTGKQYFPWIHIDDLCGIYSKAISDDKMKGAYNAAAPGHVTNKELMRNIARVLHKPSWFPNVPGFLIKLFLGAMGDASLKGSRVSSEKIEAAGYRFLFPGVKEALQEALGRSGKD
jgi:uncharacterized protein